MALTTPDPVDGSYEDFVRLHAGRFSDYLRGVLGRQAEGRGGSVPVDDTLQEALLRIYEEWPGLQGAESDERNRRLYRYLRDAAGQALRAEYVRSDPVTGRRVQIVPFAFDLGVGEYDELPVRERELDSICGRRGRPGTSPHGLLGGGLSKARSRGWRSMWSVLARATVMTWGGVVNRR